MNFQDILAATWSESEQRKSKTSFKALKHRVKDLPPTLGFAKALAAQPFSIIAELKTKSPSMGDMSLMAERVADCAHLIYQRHPVVSAISVLTQETNFGGSEKRIRTVRRQTRKPILRKDFIRDEYEVYYSRAMGADAILLMANVVTEKHHFSELHDLANSLGLDVLCEVHSEDELELIPDSAKICGINSRKFKSDGRFTWSKVARRFKMDATIDLAAFELFDALPKHTLRIAESGMTSQNIPDVLRKYAFKAALIGTSLLRGDEAYVSAELDRLAAAIRDAARNTPAHAAPKREAVYANS